MKLATYKDSSRDGQLVVVSRDLSTAHYATGIAGKLQQVLDDWNFMSPQLQDLYETLNQGKARHAFPFEPSRCMAPLPRAYQWADGSAFINHVELVRKARNAEVPESFYTDPLMYQGGSDDFIGPATTWSCRAKTSASTSKPRSPWSRATCPWAPRRSRRWSSVRLVMLANDVSLRNLIPTNWPRASAFSRASRPRPSARWR
jgi:fumarylacetoacetate (FAA) hydrolase